MWGLVVKDVTSRVRGFRRNLSLITFLSHLFTLSAYLGLLYQVTEISDLYFKYETKTAIIQSISGPVPVPNMCFCIRYTDLISSSSMGMKRAGTLEERILYQSKLTVKEILQLTPAANESITWCTFRAPDSMHSDIVSTSDCYKMFNVSKFYTQDLICYQVHPKTAANFLISRVAHSLYFSHMMFGVRFSSAFSAADKIHIIVYYGEYPWFSSNYASITTRLIDFYKMTFKNNKYYVSYLWNKHYLLPAPYDTNCSMIPISESSECKKSCMIDQLIKINKVPFSEFIRDPIGLPHVNYHDLNDSKTRDFVVRAEAMCSSRCDTNPCYTDITSTLMDANSELEIKDQLITIWSRIPLSPVISVHSSAALSLVEYLVYIGGCCGTWIGISFLSFDPFQQKYYKCLHNRQQRRMSRKSRIAATRIRYLDRNGYWFYGTGNRSGQERLDQGQK